jgi:hypothetical protein
MSKLNNVFGLGLGLVLTGSLLFTGCGDDDDSSGTSLAGVWSYVDAGVSEESVNLIGGGNLSVTSVDYEMEECLEFSGDWEAGDDSLRVNYSFGGMNFSESMAYELNGSNMTLTWEDGTSDTYTKVSTHKTCDDFDFGSGMGDFWTGSFSASIDGSPVSLIAMAYGEITTEGELVIFGTDGTTGINLYIMEENGTGTYSLFEDGMATYMPDMDNETDIRLSNGGELTITSISATHMAGTFNFTATDLMGGNAVSITNGSFDITAP